MEKFITLNKLENFFIKKGLRFKSSGDTEVLIAGGIIGVQKF